MGAGKYIKDLYNLCDKFRGWLFKEGDTGQTDEDEEGDTKKESEQETKEKGEQKEGDTKEKGPPLARALGSVDELDVVFVMFARSGSTRNAATQLGTFLKSYKMFKTEASFEDGTWVPKGTKPLPRFLGRVVICPNGKTFGPTLAHVALLNRYGVLRRFFYTT